MAPLSLPAFVKNLRRRSIIGILTITLLCLGAMPAWSDAVNRPHLASSAATSRLLLPSAAQLERLSLTMAAAQTLAMQKEQTPARRPSWIGRHPILFGAMLGFGVGFGIGYPQGNASARGDASSDYLTPEESGLFWGGASAGTGALVGMAFRRSK
mgnify:CR=1 FL=1